MTTFTIATGYDSANKRDASCVFLPESRAFKELHAGESGVDCTRLVIEDPQTAAKRRAAVEDAIRRTPGLDVLAVFGHGTATTLVATGHALETRRGPETVSGLATAIRSASGEPDIYAPDLSIILYACLTGRGKTGFADALADALPWAHVFAHSTPGHATWNPYVELAGGPRGGDPIFSPKEPGWKRWRDRLRPKLDADGRPVHEENPYRLSFWKPGHGLPREQAIEAIREEAGK